MTDYERHMERLAGCSDEECPDCGHSQLDFDGGCDECGWGVEEDDPDYNPYDNGWD